MNCANCGRPIERIESTTPGGGWYWSHVTDGGHATDCRLSATPRRRHTATSIEAILEHLEWWTLTVEEARRSRYTREAVAGEHMGQLLDAIVAASK